MRFIWTPAGLDPAAKNRRAEHQPAPTGGTCMGAVETAADACAPLTSTLIVAREWAAEIYRLRPLGGRSRADSSDRGQLRPRTHQGVIRPEGVCRPRRRTCIEFSAVGFLLEVRLLSLQGGGRRGPRVNQPRPVHPEEKLANDDWAAQPVFFFFCLAHAAPLNHPRRGIA